MLWLMDRFGAGLLTLLLFREFHTDEFKRIWNADSKTANQTCLVAAALTMGLLIAFAVYFLLPGAIWFTADHQKKAWVAFAGLPLILLAFTFTLRSLSGNFK